MIRILIVVAGLMFAAASAWAHAFLQSATPPVGSRVATSPPELTITFTEAVEPAFSTIEVSDPRGAPLALAKPHTEPGNARKLIVSLPALSPGQYTVVWHATSVDTHKTEGRFTFTVAP